MATTAGNGVLGKNPLVLQESGKSDDAARCGAGEEERARARGRSPGVLR
jgi:hypothetical protein